MESLRSAPAQSRRDVELWMSWLLRTGVLLCGGCIGLGWFFMIFRDQSNSGVLPVGQSPAEILLRLQQKDFTALVPLGIRLLILLPVLRVALSLILFLEKRDGIYVGLSAAVLSILVGSIYYGLTSAG